ncbi:MarR family transcriptional regulator [Plantibacter flavus]|uniref:MarR family transcriptional regulator n=1 Tax=Plantibacter flavus TaxID=150123 RepID=UPI003F14DCBB
MPTDSAQLLRFFDALVRSETLLWTGADAHVRASGSPALGSLSALRVIERRAGACRVQEVADDLVITVGAASKIVDRLVRDGLAERLPHPTDRRSSFIGLTPGGAAAVREGTDRLGEAIREAVGETIAPELLHDLTDALEGIGR